MTDIATLLDELNQQGVRLWADEDKLRIQAPKGTLTSDLQAALAQRKSEILRFLKQDRDNESAVHSFCAESENLSLQTIGRLIGGFCESSGTVFQTPTLDPQKMAKKLKITFRPLPNGYSQETIRTFREQLEAKLNQAGVEIEPWETATQEFSHHWHLPLINWKIPFKTRVVKGNISAVIDVERHPTLLGKVKIFLAEKLYQFYNQWKQQKPSAAKIVQFIGWADENVCALENPTNTQVIVLTQLDTTFNNPDVPYPQKIPIGVSTLIRTFSEIVIGVSQTDLSILNMNLSDASFPRAAIDNFIVQSLIPKIYVPILPLPLSRFEVSEFDPQQSDDAAQLVALGQALASTELLPSGFKIDHVIQRQSLRDIVDWMANGRTGVSYGFLAYAEPPRYVGPVEISAEEWEQLSPVPGFNPSELRQNHQGRRYIKLNLRDRCTFKQIPDIWVLSSRSGSNKTNLNLETDVLRIGLQDRLLLQLPQQKDAQASDVRPSYDTYVMVAIALATALYAPDLIAKGAPMVHFHGYPAQEWFDPQQECYTGVANPSVPCGTYESGVFNFLGIQELASRQESAIRLAALIEPDHGTNIIAQDLDYLLSRLQTGVEQRQIELGGKHFSSLQGTLTS